METKKKGQISGPVRDLFTAFESGELPDRVFKEEFRLICERAELRVRFIGTATWKWMGKRLQNPAKQRRAWKLIDEVDPRIRRKDWIENTQKWEIAELAAVLGSTESRIITKPIRDLFTAYGNDQISAPVFMDRFRAVCKLANYQTQFAGPAVWKWLPQKVYTDPKRLRALEIIDQEDPRIRRGDLEGYHAK